MSTSSDQIAIAPGYLQKEWGKDGRRYFHYRMDRPILNFYSFISACYEVARSNWNDVAIEVYYHKGHEYNIKRMIEAIKKSLEYYSVNFSPYQYRQIRIIEFPRYGTFAQSFPNTIPYSESIGFIADVESDEDKNVDVPFFVTAHELAHQWWGHQVIGGNVRGSELLSEGLSEYSALTVMEKERGVERLRKFLRYELDKYLRGRAFESKMEQPLLYVEHQNYIYYNKASLIFYYLKDMVGETVINHALSRYIDKVAYQEPPYTNSLEFYELLKAEIPDSLHNTLSDMFEKITIFKNRVIKAEAKPVEDGRFAVTLTVESEKVYADGDGNETETEVNDWIDIGIMTENIVDGSVEEFPLYLKKHKITAAKNQYTFVVDGKPTSAGIDPYYKLIDRDPDDNTIKVEINRNSEKKDVIH